MINPFKKSHMVIRTGNAFYRKDNNEKPNILNVFEYYYPEIKLRRTNKAFITLCPLHGERNPSFALYESTNTYYCFSCKATGDSYNLIMEIEQCGFKEATEIAEQHNLYD